MNQFNNKSLTKNQLHEALSLWVWNSVGIPIAVEGKYIRKYLRNNFQFSLHGFKVIGEATNDEDAEGNYDIIILHSYWENEFFSR